MRTHLYTLCWNEADMLGFFFRHYDPWVDRYVVFDDGSTDGSLELLQAHPRVELRRFERSRPDSFVMSHQGLQNQIWKESRGSADWVVITAIDEHLHVPGCPMRTFLERATARGVTLIPALGYQMLSEDFPAGGEHLCTTRTCGAPYGMMSKLSLFRPQAIEETNFAAGRHLASPVGRLRFPRRDELLLLHYKYLGFDRTLARHGREQTGLGSFDVANRFGIQYSWTESELRGDWRRFAERAVDVSSPNLRPWRSHPDERWWRPSLKSTMRRRLSAVFARR
jgi:hypothetical protein